MDPSGIEMLCRPERLCTVADREYRRWTTWSSLGLGLLAVAMIVISGTVCIPQIVKASFPNDFSCQRKNHVATMPASSQMAIPFSTGAVKTKLVPKFFALDGQEGTKSSYPAANFGTKKPDKLLSQRLNAFSEVSCRNMIQFGQEDVPTG